MKRLLVVIALAASAAVFNGCGPTRYTVTEQPVAPVYERPVTPGPEYVWVDGDWDWVGGTYVYRHGYWEKPHPNRVWITGTWVHNGKGYYWKKGYWK
jgi:hypothetical protein